MYKRIFFGGDGSPSALRDRNGSRSDYMAIGIAPSGFTTVQRADISPRKPNRRWRNGPGARSPMAGAALPERTGNHGTQYRLLSEARSAGGFQKRPGGDTWEYKGRVCDACGYAVQGHDTIWTCFSHTSPIQWTRMRTTVIGNVTGRSSVSSLADQVNYARVTTPFHSARRTGELHERHKPVSNRQFSVQCLWS